MEHLRSQWRRAAARWVFDVMWAVDKDTLKEGEVEGGYSRVFVDWPADDPAGARLTAEQIVAAGGHEPTGVSLVEYEE